MKAGIYRRRDNEKHIYVSGSGFIRAFQLSDVHPCEAKIKVMSRNNGAEVVFLDDNGDMITADRMADATHPLVNDKALIAYLSANDQEIKEALGLPADLQPGQDLADWALGRENKQFSRNVVYGYGPGFLTTKRAEAEKALLRNPEQIDALIAQAIVRVAGDGWEVVDADLYAAFLDCYVPFEPTYPEPSEDVYEAFARFNTIHDAHPTHTGRMPASDILSMPYGNEQSPKDAAMERLGYRRCHKQAARKHRRRGHVVIPSGERDGAFWWKALRS